MTTVVLGMLVALALSVAILALVAIPARREGRDREIEAASPPAAAPPQGTTPSR